MKESFRGRSRALFRVGTAPGLEAAETGDEGDSPDHVPKDGWGEELGEPMEPGDRRPGEHRHQHRDRPNNAVIQLQGDEQIRDDLDNHQTGRAIFHRLQQPGGQGNEPAAKDSPERSLQERVADQRHVALGHGPTPAPSARTVGWTIYW